LLHLICAADWVQRSGQALSFQFVTQRVMASFSRRTLSELPRRMVCSVISANPTLD